MNKQLLVETHTLNYNRVQLTENVNKDNGNLMVEGILATAEIKNGNGRYYSRDLWEREMISIHNLSKKDEQWVN